MADTFLAEMQGVTKFEAGAIGADGAMGATLTEYSSLKQGTLTYEIAPPNENIINTEQSSDPYAVLLEGTPKSFTGELLGLKLSQKVDFMGGTFTAGSGGTKDKWEAPITPAIIYKSVRITTKDSKAAAPVISYKKCQVIASQTGTATKTDLIGLQVKFVIMTPYNNAGVAQSPYFEEGEVIT